MNQLYFKTIPTILGSIFAISDDQSIHLIQFSEVPIFDRQLNVLHSITEGKKVIEKQTEPLAQLEKELHSYFSHNDSKFGIPMTLRGTEFQKKVWQELLKIPYGSTVSYSDIAKNIGYKNAHRAVGTAVGQNYFAIVIPCHRVIQKSGIIGNYAGGTERKYKLLIHEKSSKNAAIK